MYSYTLFQLRLYPMLPYLAWQASSVKKRFPLPPAQSERLILGNGPDQYLILGESTAAGVGASDQSQTLAGKFYQALGPEIQVYNFGKNGIRTGECLPYFRKDLEQLAGEKEGILLFLGANDSFKLTHPKRFKQQLQELIGYLEHRFQPSWIYLADIPPVHLFPAFPKTLQSYLKIQRRYLTSEMQNLASANPILYYQTLHLDLEPDFFSQDLIHPSDKGYQAIMDFTLKVIPKKS